MTRATTRRTFLSTTAAATAGIALAARADTKASSEKPAILGGPRARTSAFPSWPVYDAADESALLATLRTGHWFRGSGKNVAKFEAAYAKLIGAKYCVATSSGTSALIASLTALGVGPGDEVILPPYTFVACANAVLMLGALPVFADVDLETFQIDPAKIEAAVTDRTAAIMPVHIGGNAFDVDAVLAVAKKHNLPVVEDACQAVLGEWRGRRLGSFGTTGCFSFQASKNLTAGEGGAIMTDDETLAEKCFAVQGNARARKSVNGKPVLVRGANFRMSEFHAALLMAQMTRLPDQAKTRDDNAARLTALLSEIPGISPATRTDGCTRSAYHLYMFRYDKEQFAGLPRAKFLAALSAEGVPANGGYTPLNKDAHIAETLRSRGYRRAFPKEALAEWAERTACPATDRLCTEAVWFSQSVLLAEPGAIEQIATAVRKIQAHAAQIATA